MHAQDDHGLQWNFIKKSWSLVYRELIAKYWILPMIYIKILRAHGLQQQEELDFCVRERGFCGLASLVQLIPDDDAKCSTCNFEFCLRTFVSQWCDPREIVAASYGWRQPGAAESAAAQSWWSLLASPRKCYSSVKSSVCSCCWEFCVM